MKKALYILLVLIVFSCSSDENTQMIQEPTNTLIIKRINDVSGSNERVLFFDTNGRLDSITDTEALPEYNNLLSKYEYSNDDKLTNSYHTFGTEENFSTVTYSNDIINNFYYSTFGYGTNSPVIITNNTLTYLDEQEQSFDQDDLNIEFTFSSDALQYLTQRKSLLISDSNSTWNLTDFEYDSNFNLIQTSSTIRFGSPIDLNQTFTYDDKKNPIAESMSSYNLALYFLDTFYILNVSPNNIISKTNIQNITFSYEYSYNSDDYPTSITITNTSTNEVTNTLTYTYY
jgi:hypothetical protein